MDDSVDEQTEKRSRPLAPWIVLIVAMSSAGSSSRSPAPTRVVVQRLIRR